MKESDVVSGKWKKEYTLLILFNLGYIVVFYIIMNYFS